MDDMANLNSARRIRTHARIYSVGALGLGVAGVVGFFSTVGATAAHAVAHPVTSAKAKATALRHDRAHHVTPRVASVPSRTAAAVAVTKAAVSAPVRTLRPTTYSTPAAAQSTRPTVTHSPVSASKPVVVAPKPATPKPVAVAPKPVTTTQQTTTQQPVAAQPVAQYTPPPAPTHSS